jgi:hypothetical protein
VVKSKGRDNKSLDASGYTEPVINVALFAAASIQPLSRSLKTPIKLRLEILESKNALRYL